MASTTDVSPFSGSPASVSGPTASGLSLATGNPNPTSASSAPTKPKSKPRKRVNTAEKRNQHNAIERQRRETLNSKFISLARLLPALAAHRRPSKSAIVNGSIAHLTHQREQRLMAARLLRQLCAERDALAKECAEWRYANGLPAREDGATAWNDEMEEVCTVEKEQFGTFAGMEDGAGDDNEGEGDEDEDATAPSSYGGSFSMPSFIHPPPQSHAQNSSRPLAQLHPAAYQHLHQNGEMSLEQAAAVAAQASFRSNLHGNSIFDPRASASSSSDIGITGNGNGNGTSPATASASGLNMFGSSSNPWGQMSLHDLQAFVAANAASAPSGNGNVNGNRNPASTPTPGGMNGMADFFAPLPPSLSSSTASLPFNAFMSTSENEGVSPGSASNSNSGYSQHIPTPPQSGASGHAFIASLPTVQATPSPQSTHSFDDGMNGIAGIKGLQQQQQQQSAAPQQWTEQQLMLLRALQQSQQQAPAQQQQQQTPQQAFNPLSLSFANNAAAAFALGVNSSNNGNGNGNGNGTGSSPAAADSPFSMFASFTPQQQAFNFGTNSTSNGNGAPPPPLTRAQTENLEAWRKLSAMPNSSYRPSVGMGMSFDQLQQVQSRAVEGF